LARKKKTFDIGKEIKAIARERIGRIPAGKAIKPKSERRRPKHKKPPGEES
jgi:hypothetical protein